MTIYEEETMAIIKCPDCRADVSTIAASCPGCGRSEPTRLSMATTGLYLLFNAVVMPLLALVEGLSRVAQAWAIGSVILGVLALVTRGRHAVRSQAGREQWPPLTPEATAAVDREAARRKATAALDRAAARGEGLLGGRPGRRRRDRDRDRDSESDDRQGGLE